VPRKPPGATVGPWTRTGSTTAPTRTGSSALWPRACSPKRVGAGGWCTRTPWARLEHLASKSKRGSKSIDGLGPASMVSEDALTGEGRSLSAIANVEFGVEVAKLGLDGVLADEEVGAEFAVRHPSRK
jgi:hypothetical protein